jgi:hypothetical protein
MPSGNRGVVQTLTRRRKLSDYLTAIRDQYAFTRTNAAEVFAQPIS